MKFLMLEGAIVGKAETGENETVCRVFHRDNEPVLQEEMEKDVQLPVYCARCYIEITVTTSTGEWDSLD